jgi:phthiocerol/phenolphthiocerol synthesis type-I polyketide synthase E
VEAQQIYCGKPKTDEHVDFAGSQDLIDDHISRELVQIWQQILGVESITADQNYFDLGGDSSLAVQMFARIEDSLKVKLPLATLYEAPTISELTKVLRGEVSASRWSPLVEIQPQGSRPPFFCIHPHGGNVLVYRELSRLLGPEQPFFGLQSRGLDGSEPPLETIEDLADLYRTEIRKVQPRGPYFLGGYCMGGAVAYEMACQLRAAGEEVALLALFDTMEFSSFAPPSFLQMSYYNCQRFAFHAANVLRLNSEDRSRFISEKVRTLNFRLPVWIARASGKFRNSSEVEKPSEADVLGRVWKANFEAYLKYAAKPYPGMVTDIRPHSQYRLFDDSRLKWERLATGGQRVVTLPVNPPAMLSEPFVKYLAQALKQCIDQALEANFVSSNHVSNICC